jgi:hypothetical protein
LVPHKLSPIIVEASKFAHILLLTKLKGPVHPLSLVFLVWLNEGEKKCDHSMAAMPLGGVGRSSKGPALVRCSVGAS